MARLMGRDTSGASTCAAHRGLGTRRMGVLDIGAKGIGSHGMGTLDTGATDLGSLGISSPGTNARGMAAMPVHGTILHTPRLPWRHEKTRFLPLSKAARAHAAHPAGQVVETGKRLTLAFGDDACRHGWPDTAQGLQLLGRGTVGVDGRVGSEECVGESHQVGRAALSENVHVAGNVRLGGIRNGGGCHDGGGRPLQG